MRIFKRGITTADWLMQWLNVQAVLNPRTVVFYRQKLALILPYVGDIPLGDLTPAIVKAALVDVSASKSVSATTVAHVHGTLRTALKAAIVEELITAHPMTYIPMPRRANFEAQTLTEDQSRRLWAYCSGHPVGTAVIIALATGMRSGEILALEWDDIDLVNRHLNVSKTVRWVHGGPEVHPPKTRSSNRVIPISPALVRALTIMPHRFPLVIATRNGQYLSPSSTLRAYFRHALAKADCPDIRFHDLRHTAGLFLTRRYGLVVASRMLGHSSPLITARFYGHAPMEDLRAAADGIGDVLSP